MITIFTIPKPFKGHVKTIQTNAIRSWRKLRPWCQVILFGDEEGIAQIAEQLEVQHVPDVKRNEFGTPVLDYVFRTAHDLAEHDILCYVNADIILMSDFMRAIRIVGGKKRRYLIVGRRWNVDMDQLFDFDKDAWEEQVRTYAMESEKSNPYGIWMYAMDYFVFPQGLFYDIPSFAVGRAGWDNWMIYHARDIRIPVVDIGNFAIAVHQNHDYSHLSMGQEEMYKGTEAQSNIRIAGGDRALQVRPHGCNSFSEGSRSDAIGEENKMSGLETAGVDYYTKDRAYLFDVIIPEVAGKSQHGMTAALILGLIDRKADGNDNAEVSLEDMHAFVHGARSEVRRARAWLIANGYIQVLSGGNARDTSNLRIVLDAQERAGLKETRIMGRIIK